MPIEPSEVEMILRRCFPDHCKPYIAAVTNELEVVVRPVIEKLERDKNTAEQELDYAQGELMDEQQYCTELREQIEEMEGDEEWKRMVDMFWKACQRT